MKTVWVMVENFGGLTEGVEAYESEELAVTQAKERLRSHIRTRHDDRYSVKESWNEDSKHGSCPCGEFLIGVYECPVHAEHS